MQLKLYIVKDQMMDIKKQRKKIVESEPLDGVKPLLPMTKESNFRFSVASHNFSLVSPQYSFVTIIRYKDTVLSLIK